MELKKSDAGVSGDGGIGSIIQRWRGRILGEGARSGRMLVRLVFNLLQAAEKCF